jgi:hypothetical protein
MRLKTFNSYLVERSLTENADRVEGEIHDALLMRLDWERASYGRGEREGLQGVAFDTRGVVVTYGDVPYRVTVRKIR